MRPDRWWSWSLLAAAIACEVGGTLLLHASQGFTRPLPTVGVLAGYVLSILLFSRALDHGLTLGVAYGTLTGCGLLAATVLSTLVFGDPLAPLQIVGLGLILVGAIALQVPATARSRP